MDKKLQHPFLNNNQLKLKILFLLFSLNLSYFVFYCYSQGVGINTTGAAADHSAIFDASSTAQGTLITRMNTQQRNAIASPAESLLIFNTTTKCFETYVYGYWYSISCPPCSPPAAPTTGTNVPSQTQIVWNWNSVAGATGYKWSTENNYSNATDNGTSTSYTQTGLTTNTFYTLYIWAYNNCGNSATLSETQITQNVSSCNNVTVNHTAGSISPFTKTIYYNTVSTTLTGVNECWTIQNIGADHPATSSGDATESSGGWYFQFNRPQGFDIADDGITRTPNITWTTIINENSDWVLANDPCNLLLGKGWRIPTLTEWSNALTHGNWSSTDAYNSVLKIHGGGTINGTDPNGPLVYRGSTGIYWANNQSNNYGGTTLFYRGVSWMATSMGKVYGYSLRCLNP
jgi:hypothetical protein